MNVEDLTEDQAYDILLFFARKHGWKDVAYDNSNQLRFTDDGDDDDDNLGNPSFTFVWSESPNANASSDLKIVSLSDLSDAKWKSCLQQIIEICNDNRILTIFDANMHDIVLFPASMSLESMLIEYDLNRGV